MINISRLKTISYTIYLVFFLVLLRLFYWQVLKSNFYQKQLLLQQTKIEKISPERGELFDSYGNRLIQNLNGYHLSLYRPNFKDLKSAIDLIKSSKKNLLPSDLLLLESFEKQPEMKWISLKTFFDPNDISQLNQLPFDLTPAIDQTYTQVIDQKLIKGIETYYKKSLQGKSGFSYSSQDALNQTILSKKIWQNPSVNGSNLHSSINPIIQNQAETIINRGIKEFSADSGSIIILNPQSGEIIAAFHQSTATASAFKNPIVSDLYEPGSIFKPLVLAMALDSKKINQNFVCLKCGQPRIINQFSIENWDKSFHPDSTIYDIIKNSDNIGMSYIIDQLGLDLFLKYFHLLGIDQKTNIDLPGESKPLLKKFWPEIDFATASFGQGFALTQIQMITAFNVLANNGFKVQPHIISEIESNYQLTHVKTETPQKVFDQNTINTIKSVLSTAVENSPVSQFNTKNISVCAKSGTAQIAADGGYTNDSVVASYIGFAPCNNPKFTMLITLHNPKSSSWGSSTAAPLWFEISNLILPLL